MSIFITPYVSRIVDILGNFKSYAYRVPKINHQLKQYNAIHIF